MNRPDSLTPEERELARLLGRPSATGPAPAIDAAVLAAARTAVEAPAADAATWKLPPAAPVRATRKRSRLPAVFGLAASVIFAVGIAWQLKPEEPPAPPLAEPVAAPVPGAAPSSTARMEAAPALDAAPPPAPVAAPPVVQQERIANDTAAATAPTSTPAPERAQAVAPPRPEVIAAPAPHASAPAPAPPPAPAPMMSAPAPEAASAAALQTNEPALDSVVVTGSTIDRAAPRGALKSAAPVKPAPSAPGVMRRAAAPMGAPTSADDAVRALHQAVAADASLPRKQWLKRIRERRDAGDVDTARASLERYLQQYPEVRIPRDLRQLLEN
ncbi:hypothetical protein EDF74_0966 [Stenotrophomonas rhizophila]|uniref:hypothetical protein n=1 Tax=Stenotrophomonas rhizophila TaxID=216778 RepID=UPI000F4CE06F|nr:hypothetical protein [Stenotrophomonas rhizophila]ROP79898.1 hypothetical protein EDF74_0966 [Stenotrophomonas rhizophila]